MPKDRKSKGSLTRSTEFFSRRGRVDSRDALRALEEERQGNADGYEEARREQAEVNPGSSDAISGADDLEGPSYSLGRN